MSHKYILLLKTQVNHINPSPPHTHSQVHKIYYVGVGKGGWGGNHISVIKELCSTCVFKGWPVEGKVDGVGEKVRVGGKKPHFLLQALNKLAW